MADAAGSVDAVTLTALAAALEIRVPSLYNHVSGLDDLRAALALYAIAGLLGGDQGGDRGAGWGAKRCSRWRWLIAPLPRNILASTP